MQLCTFRPLYMFDMLNSFCHYYIKFLCAILRQFFLDNLFQKKIFFCNHLPIELVCYIYTRIDEQSLKATENWKTQEGMLKCPFGFRPRMSSSAHSIVDVKRARAPAMDITRATGCTRYDVFAD